MSASYALIWSAHGPVASPVAGHAVASALPMPIWRSSSMSYSLPHTVIVFGAAVEQLGSGVSHEPPPPVPTQTISPVGPGTSIVVSGSHITIVSHLPLG